MEGPPGNIRKREGLGANPVLVEGFIENSLNRKEKEEGHRRGYVSQLLALSRGIGDFESGMAERGFDGL